MLEKMTRIDLKSKSFVSCYHMNCCLHKCTTSQFTYFIYYFVQDKFKNPKIMKIQQVHQKLHTPIKQFLSLDLQVPITDGFIVCVCVCVCVQ